MYIMKKITLLLVSVIIFLFTPNFIFAQIDDIQPDLINLEAVMDTSDLGDSSSSYSENIRKFVSEIEVMKDGRISVQESIYYDFGSLQKHGIYRSIPTVKTNQDGKKYKMDFSQFKVIDKQENPYNFSIQNSSEEVKLKIGDADKFVTGQKVYRISYIVSGAMTYYSEHDELYWNVNGTEWTVPVEKVVAVVKLPETITEQEQKLVCYTGGFGSKLTNCNFGFDKGQTIFESVLQLSSGEGLSIVLGFPKGKIAVLEPQLLVPFAETLLGKLFFLALGLLATWWFFLYPFMIIYKWWKYGRDPKGLTGVTTAWFDPPKTPKNSRFMTPGEVGTLGDETVDLKDISATIVDLARRGYIKIEERKKGDYYFVKTKEFHSGLLSFESKLLTGMFGGKSEIRLKDKRLYETVTEVTTELYEGVVKEGLFPENPNSIRTFYTVLSGLALFTGNFFLAVIAFMFGRNMPAKTLEGVNAFNVAKSLKNFLTSQERQLTFQAEKQMMFEKLLPYAVAFGVEKIWAKRFETMNLTQPDWYQGYGTSRFNSVIFANNLNSSMSSFRTASAPPTSTRSTSGFSSGFSGGSSGGGGGGGGGGSW